MQLIASRSLLLLSAAALARWPAGALALQYEIPSALLEELAQWSSGIAAEVADFVGVASTTTTAAAAVDGTAATATSSAAAAATTTSTSSSCYYPDNYTISDVTTWTPTAQTNSTNTTYISFTFEDEGADITTACAYNASSVSLTNGTSLAARYACDNSLVAFIWQSASGKVTLIEETCPGQTTTKYEASGSVIPSGLECTTASNGTTCSAEGPFAANFTSLQPSPLDDSSSSEKRTLRWARRARSQPVRVF